MKKNKTNLIMVLFFFIGLMVLFYPALSNYTNEKLQSKAIDNYEKLIKNIEVEDYTKYFTKADEYNKKLRSLNKPLVSYKKLGNYSKIINVDGKGMIGYIDIDKLKIELPIYAGTSEEVLNKSVGQLEGTSLPVGGIGTHSVLSAHRGLPSSKLFTDLDKLEIGDTFIIKVLDRTLTYEIDQILIVKPEETDALNIINDSDHVTLMTCTPYGINTHRMLVRGKRIENAKIKTYVSNEAFQMNKLLVTPIACIPILIIWLLSIAFKPIDKHIDYKLMFVYPNKYKEEEEKKKKLKEKRKQQLIKEQNKKKEQRKNKKGEVKNKNIFNRKD